MCDATGGDGTACFRTNLEVDAAGVAHERLAQGDAALLAPDHAALEHKPVLVDLEQHTMSGTAEGLQTRGRGGIVTNMQFRRRDLGTS